MVVWSRNGINDRSQNRTVATLLDRGVGPLLYILFNRVFVFSYPDPNPNYCGNMFYQLVWAYAIGLL